MKHFYDQVENNSKEYPRYYITHYNGNKDYTIMVMAWDVKNDVCRGWFPLDSFGTIRECRSAMKNWH